MEQLQLNDLQAELERLRAEMAAMREDHSRQLAELQHRLDSLQHVEIDAEQSAILVDPEWRRTLAQWLPQRRWKLQYRGSRDTLGHLAFHAHCDNQGPALVLVQSKDGHVFGGYTRVGFIPRDGYTTDADAFLFTLRNPHGVPPTRLECVSPSTAITNHHLYLPIFGGGAGHDICLYDNGHVCNIRFPRSYNDSTHIGKTLFTGSKSFFIQEIEVFVEV